MNSAPHHHGLIEAANAAIAKGDFTAARELMQGALAAADTALQAALLVRLTKLSAILEDWPAAVRFGTQALQQDLDAKKFADVSVVVSIGLYKAGGTAAVQRAYPALRERFKAFLDGVSEYSRPLIGGILQCAIVADDIAFARDLYFIWFRGASPPQQPVIISNYVPLKAWGAQDPGAFVPLELPRRFTSDGSTQPYYDWDYETVGFNVGVITRGEILAGWDYVVTPSGDVISDISRLPIQMSMTATFPQFVFEDVRRVLHLWENDTTYLDLDVVYLGGAQEQHVGHWIIDYLPRLRALSLYPDLKVAVSSRIDRKQKDFLALCGIGQERLVTCETGRRYCFRRLVVTQCGHPPFHIPSNISFVGDALRKVAPPRAGVRLYLERHVESRRIVNHADVDLVLSQFGFVKINLAKMSVAEQQERLSDAEIVIATYGSDLLAYYFMNEGAHLVELNWAVENDSDAAKSCHTLGLQYHLLICDERSGQKTHYKKDRDIVLDCVALTRLLINTVGTIGAP